MYWQPLVHVPAIASVETVSGVSKSTSFWTLRDNSRAAAAAEHSVACALNTHTQSLTLLLYSTHCRMATRTTQLVPREEWMVICANKYGGLVPTPRTTLKPDARGRCFWLPCGYRRVDITNWLFFFEVHGVEQQLSCGQIVRMHPDLKRCQLGLALTFWCLPADQQRQSAAHLVVHTHGALVEKQAARECCLCHCKLNGSYGHNPYPLATGEDDECCDACNVDVVRARMEQMREAK